MRRRKAEIVWSWKASVNQGAVITVKWNECPRAPHKMWTQKVLATQRALAHSHSLG